MLDIVCLMASVFFWCNGRWNVVSSGTYNFDRFTFVQVMCEVTAHARSMLSISLAQGFPWRGVRCVVVEENGRVSEFRLHMEDDRTPSCATSLCLNRST